MRSILLLISSFLCVVSSEKILFLLPIATKSHKNVFEPLILALADRNHSVTVASPTYFSKPHGNIREIVPVPYDKVFTTLKDPFEQRREGIAGTFKPTTWNFIFEACDAAYSNPEFKALAQETFDLVLYNGLMNHCFHGLMYKIRAPTIMVTTMAAHSFLAEAVGNFLPPSFVPLSNLDASDDMSFKDRLLNTVLTLSYNAIIYGHFDSVYQRLYARHLEDDTIPPPFAIDGNVSLILSNSYFPLTYPRPLLPDIVEVGGMHCRPARKLPQVRD